MSIEGVNNVQVTSIQVPQGKVTEPEVVTMEKSAPVQEPVKVSIEDSGNREISNEQIKKAVTDMNKRMQNTVCQYGVHEGTGRVTIKMIDKETKDVIKEIPAEETLELIAKAWELAGIMIDKRL